MIICIAGLPGSGKSMAAKILSRKGLAIVEMGDVIRKIMSKERVNSNEIRSYSIIMRKKYGKNVFAKKTMSEVRKKGRGSFVISGLRSVQELDFFKKNMKGVYLLALVAPLKQRFQRSKYRKNHENLRTLSRFKEREEQEKRAYVVNSGEKKSGPLKLVEIADFVVYNTGSIADLTRSLNTVLMAMREREGTY